MTTQTGHGPLAKYVKFWVAHTPGMPGAFSPPPQVSDPDMHHGTCVTHVPRYMPGSPTGGSLWSRWRGKRSRHSRCMRNPQFYVSGKRPMRGWLYWLSRISTNDFSVFRRGGWIISHVGIYMICENVCSERHYDGCPVTGMEWLDWFNINSSPPSAAYMRPWIGSALVQIIACCLFGTRLLSKPILSYRQLHP